MPEVEIGKCVLCGKPVLALIVPQLKEEDWPLLGAGEITMKFAYGSERDSDFGTGFIHDICSVKLDHLTFESALSWNRLDTIDTEETIRTNKITHLK
jgi:hypothetical protein